MLNQFLTKFRIASIFVAVAMVPAVHAQSTSADEATIRVARQALNTALEKRDVEHYAAYWSGNPEVVWAGTNGLVAGREANIARLGKVLQGAEFLYGVRTPEHVDINPADGAAESGNWRWAYHRNGKDIEYQGRYLVGWRKIDGSWKVQSEMYVLTGCKPACS
jgi:ketosteroid isomerase-like protein